MTEFFAGIAMIIAIEIAVLMWFLFRPDKPEEAEAFERMLDAKIDDYLRRRASAIERQREAERRFPSQG